MMVDLEATMDRLETELDAVIDRLGAAPTLAARHALEVELEALEMQMLVAEHEWNRWRRAEEAAAEQADAAAANAIGGALGAAAYLHSTGGL